MSVQRIFIAIHYMEIGGAERALLGLLELFSKFKYDVDLFIYSHQGELMKHIPAGINILAENESYSAIEKPLLHVLSQGKWKIAMARLLSKLNNWFYNRKLKGHSDSIYDELGRTTTKILPNLYHLGTYDVAISFLRPHHFVRDKVIAKRKLAWIHTDYSCIAINSNRELSSWETYDHVVSISEDVTKSFLEVFPTLKGKVLEIDNPLPVNLIKEQADQFDATDEMPGKIKLLSIGRYCTPKNFPGAVAIMAELCKLRNDVVWYVIGYGGGEQEIREAIIKHNMQDKFILLGKKSNPYPYIKACDIYVQPSIFEGKSITVKEAQLLGKPVAITNYPTAHSQIRDGEDGVILPLGDSNQTAKALNDLLNNKTLLRKISTFAHVNTENIIERLFS